MYAHKPTSESLNPAVSLTCTSNPGFTNRFVRPKTPLFTPGFMGILSLSPKSDCKGTTFFLYASAQVMKNCDI